MITRPQRTTAALLKLRRLDEVAARVAFEQARADVEAARARLEALRGDLAQRNHLARETLLRGAPPRAGAYRRAVTQLKAAIEDESRRLVTAKEALEKLGGRLMEAMKQRKAVESLKTRLDRRRSVELSRAETRRADDVHAAFTACRGRASRSRMAAAWRG